MGLIQWLEGRVSPLRGRRVLHVWVAVLRIFLAFGMLPAGLKKLLGQPFTDPANGGPFHTFLHAFYATGFFYELVGVFQLVAAFLLMGQRYAFFGALVLLPVLTAILGLCWSTGVYPTASVVTLMWLGTLGLLVWELDRWRGLLGASEPVPFRKPLLALTDARADADARADVDARGLRQGGEGAGAVPLVLRSYWERGGLLIFGLYLLPVLVTGEVYRPRGVELTAPGFWVLPGLLGVLGITAWCERRAWQNLHGAPPKTEG